DVGRNGRNEDEWNEHNSFGSDYSNSTTDNGTDYGMANDDLLFDANVDNIAAGNGVNSNSKSGPLVEAGVGPLEEHGN
ncbi:unnamed protein product, partial [Ilex paraguariensis]